jgi:hypothetical protein
MFRVTGPLTSGCSGFTSVRAVSIVPVVTCKEAGSLPGVEAGVAADGEEGVAEAVMGARAALSVFGGLSLITGTRV